MQRIGVYWLVHTKTGHFYVGSSGRLNIRYNSHVSLLSSGVHHVVKLQSLYNGDPNLDWIVREVGTREEAYDLEIAIIKENMGNPLMLNILALRGGSLPQSLDPTRKQRDDALAASLRGVPKTEEHRKNISKGKLGGKHTEETKELMSSQRKGRDNTWNRRAVVIDGVEYVSLAHAAESLNLNKATVFGRVKNPSPSFANWAYKDEDI